ncbi:MFS transporter [Mycobacterium sp. ACS4331]|uniref:MFS transporter n=1 Tax=Mycobacterium sp. ACS4331 TaxID=1834121 RepID=UPI0007FDAB41|nr:MFS transporter [Mycobacterium sp. ACS4331]OBF26162.1 MFS transporter [Mycobacterium sp. ACS4331]
MGVLTSTQPDQDTEARPSTMSMRARVWTVFLACCALSLVMSSMVALNTALPDIALETAASQTQLTWIVDSYTLVLACLLLPAGALGDRFGRRGALIAGLVLFALASVAPLLWTTANALILARAAAGVGAALIMPATLSLITTSHPADQRTKAVSIWAGVSGVGGLIGMLGSGLLLRYWEWPAIFWTFAICAAALAVLTATMPTSRDEDPKPLDWIGALLIGAAVATFVFGILEAPIRGWDHPLVYGCLAGGALLAGAFAAVERHRRHPLLDVRLFADEAFATGAASVTVLFLALFGFFFVIVQQMQMVMGYSALGTAVAISPLGVPMLALSGLSHRILPRLGLRLAVFIGLMLVAAGYLCMRILETDSPYWHLAVPLLIISCGIGLCVAPTTSAIMTSVPDAKQGVASAVNDATREIGAALGIALAGSMLASQYTRSIASQLNTFPVPIQEAAGRSLGEAMGAAERLGPQGQVLLDLSRAAFVDGVHASLTSLAVLIAVAAVLIGLWAPGRDGRQLALLRRLTRRD